MWPGKEGLGKVWLGLVWHGGAGHGKAWQSLFISHKLVNGVIRGGRERME